MLSQTFHQVLKSLAARLFPNPQRQRSGRTYGRHASIAAEIRSPVMRAEPLENRVLLTSRRKLTAIPDEWLKAATLFVDLRDELPLEDDDWNLIVQWLRETKFDARTSLAGEVAAGLIRDHAPMRVKDEILGEDPADECQRRFQRAITSAEFSLPAPSSELIGRLPEGSVSIEMQGATWTLRASQSLQSRFEELLERRKAGLQSEDEARDYEAICSLDQLLSGFNRLARRVQQG